MEAAEMSSVCGDLEGTREVAGNYAAPQISGAAGAARNEAQTLIGTSVS